MSDPQITLDPSDFSDEPADVNTPVETQDTTAEESSPEETNTPEVAKSQETETPEAEEEGLTAEDTEADDKPQGKAEERKQQLNTEIRDLVSQRNELRAEVERTNSQVYGVQSPQELMNAGFSEAKADVEALRQQIEFDKFNNQVADVQLTLSSESQRVLGDFPMFNPGSDQFNPAVASQAADLLRQQLVTDPNTGQIIGANVSPYQLYKTIADAAKGAATEAQVTAQRATDKMVSSVDAPSSAPPKEAKMDPFLAGLLGKS